MTMTSSWQDGGKISAIVGRTNSPVLKDLPQAVASVFYGAGPTRKGRLLTEILARIEKGSSIVRSRDPKTQTLLFEPKGIRVRQAPNQLRRGLRPKARS